MNILDEIYASKVRAREEFGAMFGEGLVIYMHPERFREVLKTSPRDAMTVRLGDERLASPVVFGMQMVETTLVGPVPGFIILPHPGDRER